MTDRYEFPTGRLPESLERLDAELSSIWHEERPSFAPELEAELAREWRTLRGRSRRPVREPLAAGLAALLLVGMGVPSARAALVRFAEALGVVQPRMAPAPPAGEPAPMMLPAPEDGAPPAEEYPTGALVVGPRGLEAPTSPSLDLPAPGAMASVPELLDRGWVEAVIRRHYPMSLQRAGIGGVVGVLLWVDSAGSVDFVNLGSSSGVPDLDRAALQIAPSLRFEPARRGGRAVGTWVEFDVRFEPRGEGLEPDWLSGLAPLGGPAHRPGEVAGTGSPAVPGSLTAEDLLRSALGDEAAWAHLGPAAAILSGEVPPGRGPTEWRGEVSRVLVDALDGSSDNPAPFLALARLRLRQGLRPEAQLLLERGLVSQGNWEAARWRGRVRSNVVNPAACPDAPGWAGGGPGFVPAETLLAWNYLCPEALEEILSRSFEPLAADASVDRALTLTSFRAAVEAYPAHPEANVAALLGLAEEGRWEDLLRGARRFVTASEGDGHGMLLEGLALQRLSRSEEAQRAFEAGLARVSGNEAATIRNIAPSLLESEASEYARLPRERRGHAGGVTPEYVTVWLGDVRPGRYALRLVVSIAGAGAPLVAEQALDRR
jgi:TonB family protein